MYEDDELFYTQEDINDWILTSYNLRDHIKEQDKEIERLKIELEKCSNDKWYIDLDKLKIPNEIEKQIRKQVCDEIKEYIAKEYGVSVEDMPKTYHFLSWTVKEIYELLDQIEQGGEYDKNN